KKSVHWYLFSLFNYVGICTYLLIFIYVCNVCFASGFKRGADPGMPEPTIWRYVLFQMYIYKPVFWGLLFIL
uniref:Uncharacterized protein n=1 Tax=Zosterops lateralis melanops TaxID=1220523 RepID=A0A8D2PH76_ZOSLA